MTDRHKWSERKTQFWKLNWWKCEKAAGHRKGKKQKWKECEEGKSVNATLELCMMMIWTAVAMAATTTNNDYYTIYEKWWCKNARKVKLYEQKKNNRQIWKDTHTQILTCWERHAYTYTMLERFGIGLSINKYILYLYMHMPFMFRISLESIIILQSFLLLFLFLFLLFNFCALLSINIRLFSCWPRWYFVLFIVIVKEKERRVRGRTTHFLIEYSITMNITEIGQKQKTRPIKYIPTSILCILHFVMVLVLEFQ